MFKVTQGVRSRGRISLGRMAPALVLFPIHEAPSCGIGTEPEGNTRWGNRFTVVSTRNTVFIKLW